MRRFFTVVGSLALGTLLVCGQAKANCAGLLASTAGGTWKVNNAGGTGFGGWFVDEEGEVWNEQKPEVDVAFSNGALILDESIYLRVSEYGEEDTEGGTWCAFTLSNGPNAFSGRIAHADNGWWILELGAHDGNQIELIKR